MTGTRTIGVNEKVDNENSNDCFNGLTEYFKLQDWLDKVCIPYPDYDTGYRRETKLSKKQEYRDAYNTYLNEFENCE